MTQVRGRWGKALKVPGHYQLTIHLAGKVAVNYGMIRIPENEWMEHSDDFTSVRNYSRRFRFRAFGHRVKEYEQGDCEDTGLIFSDKKAAKKELHELINSVEAKDGTTPLTYSILQAARVWCRCPR
jgi:hypothetical protein